jgi:hypothetical protein
VVAVDGKRKRRGYERGRACMPPLMVSVWDAEMCLSLAAQHAVGGNEVAATLAALKSLVLKGCIVTADALHCHPAKATEVCKTDAHYALKLKANNAPLFTCVQAAFAIADRSGKLPSARKASLPMIATNGVAPASLRGQSTHLSFLTLPPSAVSKRSATRPMVRSPRWCITWSRPNV